MVELSTILLSLALVVEKSLSGLMAFQSFFQMKIIWVLMAHVL